jgi:hypothetical protein
MRGSFVAALLEDDGEGPTTARATADPCGMTTRKAKAKVEAKATATERLAVGR